MGRESFAAVAHVALAASSSKARGVCRGDRLTGISEFLPARTDELRTDCLVIDPLFAPISRRPTCRCVQVPTDQIRRVVWEEQHQRLFRPNTLYYRDGRQTTFRSLRWSSSSVRLLVEQGVEEVAWTTSPKCNSPNAIPWEEYADQLAVLMPDLAGKLVRLKPRGACGSLRRSMVFSRDRRRRQAGIAIAHHAAGVEHRRR